MDTNFFLGSRINNYEILECIGHGGMGDVYLAKHPQIGKKVAIKLLRPESSQLPKAVQRFFHEAKVVDEIHHPNVVDVLDFGQTPEGQCYIIMEYLEGESLSSLIIGEETISLELIGHIGLQICSALAAAHSKGIIHRDLKSDNVFLIDRDSTEKFVKIFDFGIAKLLEYSPKMLTTDGITMGTPVYMSPEQAMGRSINGQTDIYALGVLLYYMATKTYPFFDTNPVVVANMQVSAPLPLPSERFPGIDRGLESVIVNCLEKDQSLRYASMQDVAAALGPICGLDVANYFGKKRGPNSLEFNAPVIINEPNGDSFSEEFGVPPIINYSKEPSLVMLSSEIIAKTVPVGRHFPLAAASCLLALIALGLFISFSGTTFGGEDSSLEANIPALQAPPILEAAPSSAPIFTPKPTSILTRPEVLTEASTPATSKNNPKTTPPKKAKRPGALKKFQWLVFTKKSTPEPKKTKPSKAL